jgi:hypothetical protein
MIRTLCTAACLAVLATPAITRPWAAQHCGHLQIAVIPDNYFNPARACSKPCDNMTHFFDMIADPQDKHRLSNKFFRYIDDSNRLFYKGKKCVPFSEQEYDALGVPLPRPRPITLPAATAGTPAR